MVKIGDKVTEFLHVHGAEHPRLRGTVVYIHPELRYYTVEFWMGSKPQYGSKRAQRDKSGRDPNGIYLRESYLCDPEDRMRGRKCV